MSFGQIYIVTNKINGKMYVGQTVKSVAKRWRDHCRSTSRCKALYCAIAKYGEDSFTVREMAIGYSHSHLNELEDVYVKVFDTLAPNGYNLKDGGGSKGRWSDEIKSKISRSHNSPEATANFVAKSIAMWQRPETRKKISEAIRVGLSAPGVKAKRSAIAKIANNTPLAKERMSLGQIERFKNVDERIKATAVLKALWADDAKKKEMLKAHAVAMSAPAHRKNVSDKMKHLWQDPEYRARMTRLIGDGKRRTAKVKDVN